MDIMHSQLNSFGVQTEVLLVTQQQQSPATAMTSFGVTFIAQPQGSRKNFVALEKKERFLNSLDYLIHIFQIL